ncbi:helix-turn-helix domain-containing protein [Leekyejoonella antrihumi]|uniref:helix-turn-helix domain-containing protein n=1 Tax=Leekyejoonella antrihumi TaxID=1660198 RepID=UPI001648FBAF|nr:cupin domain-containing protein [Leekyejoonella antrihumi]
MNAYDNEASVGTPTGDGALDQDFLSQVGSRIRALRTIRTLTVQQLADRSQISRRLLTQIELGQANPSLVTVTRIARELGTEFTNLLGDSAADAPVVVHPQADHTLVWSSQAGSSAHLLIATAESRSADLWLWHLAPGDTYRGQADPTRSQELFYVLAGTLTITVDDQEVVVPTGASCRLRSDRLYAYVNGGDQPVDFVRTVVLAA